MKTAMQQMVSIIDSLCMENFSSPHSVVDLLKSEATELLEVEKQQVIDAWIEGNKQRWEQSTDHPQDAETYYTTHFKK